MCIVIKPGNMQHWPNYVEVCEVLHVSVTVHLVVQTGVEQRYRGRQFII